MEDAKMLSFIKDVLTNMPTEWLRLTTHRLDIYDEKLAKTQFLDQFQSLYSNGNATAETMSELPTAFDYIRLGHPLSCVLEWAIAGMNGSKADNAISFSSKTTPVLAILRKNLLSNKSTHIIYTGALPSHFDAALIQQVYGYNFELTEVSDANEITEVAQSKNADTTVFLSHQPDTFNAKIQTSPHIDFYITSYGTLGSVLLVNGEKNEKYISEIQHVRRRETIAMTPANTLTALQMMVGVPVSKAEHVEDASDKSNVEKAIQKVADVQTKALVGSSGLSIQYAIMMGLIHDANEQHPGKPIRIIVPPNCYGGTNDQARRVAACVSNVEVMDLPVDGGNDMTKSIDIVLNKIASEDAVPYIIAEIPTNPRVEVPDLNELQRVLNASRTTTSGATAVDPVFILDQTFCPNVHFLGDQEILANVRTISYASGSKFPSGGLCTAGYCIANKKAAGLIDKIELHLNVCDNEATSLQYAILAKQMPSMNQRIHDAYKNTRAFVNFISDTLPTAKINFVSEELADQGFTPSVFSLDLPTKGNSDEERENYKRELNLKLINMMITEIPNESKYCVSYGQLKGCYWTIPATSTQGTTKEGDKDYIARVALSANMDLERHKKVFSDFVEEI